MSTRADTLIACGCCCVDRMVCNMYNCVPSSFSFSLSASASYPHFHFSSKRCEQILFNQIPSILIELYRDWSLLRRSPLPSPPATQLLSQFHTPNENQIFLLLLFLLLVKLLKNSFVCFMKWMNSYILVQGIRLANRCPLRLAISYRFTSKAPFILNMKFLYFEFLVHNVNIHHRQLLIRTRCPRIRKQKMLGCWDAGTSTLSAGRFFVIPIPLSPCLLAILERLLFPLQQIPLNK